MHCCRVFCTIHFCYRFFHQRIKWKIAIAFFLHSEFWIYRRPLPVSSTSLLVSTAAYSLVETVRTALHSTSQEGTRHHLHNTTRFTRSKVQDLANWIASIQKSGRRSFSVLPPPPRSCTRFLFTLPIRSTFCFKLLYIYCGTLSSILHSINSRGFRDE